MPRPRPTQRCSRLATVLVAAATAACTAPAPDATTSTSAPSSVPSSAVSSATSSPAIAPTATPTGPVASQATTVLTLLQVKGRAPKTGYEREQFGPAWTDDNDVTDGRNGCDTRNDVLARDLTAETFRPGTRDCVVLRGTLRDPYTNTVIAFIRGVGTSAEVQIDHVVSLSNAWQTGAQQLPERTRRNLANDPLNLLAVDGPANQSKGDGDAATWLPPNRSYRCAYVARQISVKHLYRLWVTAAEHDAMARVLATCPYQQVPRG